MSLAEDNRWLENFLKWVVANKGLVESTKEAYGRDLRSFCAWLHSGGGRLTTVTEDQIASYVVHIRDSGYQLSTIARTVVAIRQFFSFLVYEQEVLAEDPSAEIAVPTVPDGSPKALTIDQIQSLLESPVGDEPVTYRDRAILEVLYGCGLRVGELVGLQIDDVDLDGQLLRVFGKGRRERIVPLGSPAADSLSHPMSGAGRNAVLNLRGAASRGAESAVFLSVGGPKRGTQLSRMGAWRVVRHHGDKVGLGDELTPHVLRHSCATHMLINGADIRYVQELLGHVSIRNTQRYTAVREDELREIYLQAHPRAEARLPGR
ncbi:MAG TPA: site-specific tyrosine recombinase XerD [Acidimicrobiaceae bacterium]|nr:site-specific tyrosine recombinase XerD [Acidimicrobiaceae bacterium]